MYDTSKIGPQDGDNNKPQECKIKEKFITIFARIIIQCSFNAHACIYVIIHNEQLEMWDAYGVYTLIKLLKTYLVILELYVHQICC